MKWKINSEKIHLVLEFKVQFIMTGKSRKEGLKRAGHISSMGEESNVFVCPNNFPIFILLRISEQETEEDKSLHLNEPN